MKFILSKTILTNWEEEIPAGSYKGLHVRFAGTNKANQTMAIGDIGNLLFSINGIQTHFVSTGLLADLNNQWYGYVESASASGESFSFGLFLPFEYPGFKNSLYVSAGDNAFLNLQVGSAVATKVDSWSIEVNGVHGNELENYLMYIRPANRSYSAAITHKDRIPDENIIAIYVNSSTVSRVMVERDGELIHECSYNALISETSLKHRVEGALINYGALALGDQVSDMLSDDVQLQITTSGSGSANIGYIGFMFDARRRSNSIQTKSAKVSSRIAPISQKRPADVETAKRTGSAD